MARGVDLDVDQKRSHGRSGCLVGHWAVSGQRHDGRGVESNGKV
jgi:hypothetical protein